MASNNAQTPQDKAEQTAGKGVARFPWLRISCFILACAFAFSLQGPLGKKIWRKINPPQKTTTKTPKSNNKKTAPASKLEKKVSAPKPVEKKLPPPEVKAPVVHTATSGGNIRKMSKGMMLETKVTLEKGQRSTVERIRDQSYVASYELKIKLPQAARTLTELEQSNNNLSKMLPGLKEMMPTAQVSRFYYDIYQNKTNRIKENAAELNQLMTRHNFYDCETILNLRHPRTGRKALLVQAEMDVVSDGSDGDRLPTMPDKIVNSTHYQPSTSYGWRKTGTVPNPLIAGWKRRIQKARAEIAQSSTKPDRKAWLKMRIRKIQREIEEMKIRSFLIADHDPFIVMPINMVKNRSDQYAARIGDYAVVVHGQKIYPAIVGDAGPSFKVGEASLRMAKEINPRASSYSRPVSDLTVTYLVFPRSAEKFGPPNYGHWRERCLSLLSEVGGLGEGVKLYEWADTLPKPETEQAPDGAEAPASSGS